VCCAAVAALLLAFTAPAGASAPSHQHPMNSASTKTIKITGFALCSATMGTPSPCSTVTLSGTGYDGGSVSPNAYLGFDYGKFTFTDVTVPNDLSDTTFTVHAEASSASAGNDSSDDCSKSFDVKGALVLGDTYAIDWGTGPWGLASLCKD
jgi:hypothetical protein